MDMRDASFAPGTPRWQADLTRSPVLPQPVGTARELQVAPDERLMMVSDPRNLRCERIRILRTELMLRRPARDRAESIALVSPHPGEGRSMLAAELALAFAETGCPTLLVDGDLRHPHQHVYFGSPNQMGLSQALTTGVAPQLQTVRGSPRMSVLTAGIGSGNPLELLASDTFAAMLDEWRQGFEFIVIDTAPAAHYADGLAVASLAGRVLALSRAQHTPSRDMEMMLRRLSATRSEILGAVINHF